MKTIKFDRHQRKALLKPFVRSIWSIDVNNQEGRGSTMPFYADGMPGLMFQYGDHPLVLNGSKKLATLFLYGQTVKPITLTTSARSRITVVHFFPDVTKALFSISSNELTDSCVDISLLSLEKRHSVVQQLQDAHNEQDRIDVIEQFIAELMISKGLQFDKEVRYATEHLDKVGGNKRISELASELKISERTLSRRFEQHVGVVPKLFASICKFQKATAQLQRGQFGTFSSLAFDLGYSDQSHFNRSFKRFSGRTPLEFIHHRGEYSLDVNGRPLRGNTSDGRSFGA